MYFKTTQRETANGLNVVGSLLKAPEVDMSTLIRSGSCRHVDEQRSTGCCFCHGKYYARYMRVRVL